MNKIVANCLGHDGMRFMKVISDAEFGQPVRYFPRIPEEGRKIFQVTFGRDELLDLFSMELTWPIFGPWEVAYDGPRKFRRLMMANYAYAGKVSDVIERARVEYFALTHFAPGYAFVRELPKGAEDGMDVHGLLMFQAEWMPGRCVAVGGR